MAVSGPGEGHADPATSEAKLGHVPHVHGAHGVGPHDDGPADEDSHAHAGHGHHHGVGGRDHAPTTFGRAFAIAVALNGGFVLIEAGAGWAGHSVALLADAGHNVSDLLGLVVAWLATLLTARPPTRRFTFGFGASSMLAALFNAVLLLIVVGALSLEAIQRLADPAPVAGGLVMVVAAVAVVVNGATALLFMRGREHDINVRGAYLHMASDALVSIGVLASGGVILATGWVWLDPTVSLCVNLVIVIGTWSLLRDSLALCLQGVPPGIDAADVEAYLRAGDGVAGLHDLHIWPMSTRDVALSAHLVMPAGHPGDAFLARLAGALHDRFQIGHMTVQIETSADNACPLASGHRPTPA